MENGQISGILKSLRSWGQFYFSSRIKVNSQFHRVYCLGCSNHKPIFSLKNAGNGVLESQILKLFWGSNWPRTPLDAHAFGTSKIGKRSSSMIVWVRMFWLPESGSHLQSQVKSQSDDGIYASGHGWSDWLVLSWCERSSKRESCSDGVVVIVLLLFSIHLLFVEVRRFCLRSCMSCL